MEGKPGDAGQNGSQEPMLQKPNEPINEGENAVPNNNSVDNAVNVPSPDSSAAQE